MPPSSTDIQNLLQLSVDQIKSGRLDEAKLNLETVAKVEPNNHNALFLLSIVLSELNINQQAIDLLKKCIELGSQNPGIYPTLSELYIKENQYQELVSLIEPVIDQYPGHIVLYNSLGIAYTELKQYHKAQSYLETSIQLDPRQPGTYNLLGILYTKQKLNHKAIELLKRGLELDPSYGTLYTNLAQSYMQVGLTKEAIAAFEQALKTNPESELQDLHKGLLFQKQHDPDATNEEFLELAKKIYSLGYAQIPKNQPVKKWDPKFGKRMKIAYVSGDFHQHPVGDFALNIVRNHNREEFEVYCYYNNTIQDHVNELTVEAADHFRDIAELEDAEVLKLIAEDGIDVLIDIAGVTNYDRMSVFAAKPCPLQVMWIGYFGTLGMPEMDYLIGDHNTVTPDEEHLYLEKVYKLPYSYLPGEPYGIDHEIREVPSIKNGYITFSAFNKMPKITPQVMDVWSEILNRVPNSRLLFKNTCLDDPGTKQMIWDHFQAKGIEEERIILESYSPRKEFLDKYNDVDISLDTFPYGGGVTTIESLLMGVPVITWHGDRWMCRASSSYLKVLEYPELIAATHQEYIDKAVELANDPERLKHYRANLRGKIRNSEINAHNHVKNFENALKEMYLQD